MVETPRRSSIFSELAGWPDYFVIDLARAASWVRPVASMWRSLIPQRDGQTGQQAAVDNELRSGNEAGAV